LLVAAAFGLPGGVITVRMGLGRAFAAGWWLVALVTLTALVPNFPAMLALRLLFGLGFALVLTATGPLLLQWFRPREVLVMNGLDTACLSLGIALSVSTSAPLAELLGWQNSLSAFGSVGALGAAAWTFLGKAPGARDPVDTNISFSDVARVLKNRAIILLLAADAGVLIQYTALSGWLPTFYTEVRHMTPTQAGFVTGILPFVGVFAVLVGGFLPLRFGSPKSYFILSGVMVAIAGPGSFFLSNTVAIYLSLIVVGIGSWLYVPTLLTRTMELAGMNSKNVAIVWGSLITFSGLGMFLSPVVVGVLRDTLGSFLPGFTISAFAAWALLLAGILMPTATPKSRSEEP